MKTSSSWLCTRIKAAQAKAQEKRADGGSALSTSITTRAAGKGETGWQGGSTRAKIGRRGFLDDVDELTRKKPWAVDDHGVAIVNRLTKGRDEGTCHVVIDVEGGPSPAIDCSVTLVITHTNDYPKAHSVVATLNDESSADATAAVKSVSTAQPRPLHDTIVFIVQEIANGVYSLPRHLFASPYKIDSSPLPSDDGEDGNRSEEDDDDDDDDCFGGQKKQLKVLQSDFKQVISAGYQPSMTRFSPTSFTLAVSCRVLDLGIEPEVLIARDPRLLEKSYHLVLIIGGLQDPYSLDEVARTQRTFSVSPETSINFHVGLCQSSKPCRNVLLQTAEGVQGTSGEDEKRDFEGFSLSESLEGVLNDQFMRLVDLRISFEIGWAGAELLLAKVVELQERPDRVFERFKDGINNADQAELDVRWRHTLPADSLYLDTAKTSHQNLPWMAYSFLVRRLMLSALYCVVCHKRTGTDIETLIPHVCESEVCADQYYKLKLGLSVEREIVNNPTVVDLLVSLTYVAARDGGLQPDGSLPTGMGIRVPTPNCSQPTHQSNHSPSDAVGPGSDGLVDFDRLPFTVKSETIADKSHGKEIAPAAWKVLRWCVASCQAHIEDITNEDDLVSLHNNEWRQFRFLFGAPNKEERFRRAVKDAKAKDHNAVLYPTIYAFHGSCVEDWHSIIRVGLHYKMMKHGRSHGNGVYFSRDGKMMRKYSKTTSTFWRSSQLRPCALLLIAEIVNQPKRFVCRAPALVIDNTDWIMARYLVVETFHGSSHKLKASAAGWSVTALIDQDPSYPLYYENELVQIPSMQGKIDQLVKARRGERRDDLYDEEDRAVLQGKKYKAPKDGHRVFSLHKAASVLPIRPKDDWKPGKISHTLVKLLPPPDEASRGAARAVKLEYDAVLNLQNKAKSLKELGFYLPPEFNKNKDNLFQWIVELHSFDPSSPIAEDMKKNNINSFLFEIRFPPDYKSTPPFVRLITPRVLPFVEGGGGHITGGGSICIDLLTDSGWDKSYSMEAVLMQIRLAISDGEPRPARLAYNWALHDHRGYCRLQTRSKHTRLEVIRPDAVLKMALLYARTSTPGSIGSQRV